MDFRMVMTTRLIWVEICFQRVLAQAALVRKNTRPQHQKSVRHNQISNVNNKDVPHALKQISLNYSPASVHDVAEVLLEKMRERGGMSMSTDDAAGLLETERFRILSQATQVTNENNQVLQKDVSSVSMCMPCNDGTGTMASLKNSTYSTKW